MCATRGLFVTVALMSDLYPRQESNLQLTRLKLVVFTVSPRGYIGHGFGFPICVHTFSSCVILREITRCPPKNPYFLSAQKFVKRPYYRLVYFNRPSSTFYIQEPIPSYGENESGWPEVRTGLEPVTFRQFPTERSTNSSTWPTGKTDGYVNHLQFEWTFTIFPFFFERFPQ